MRVPSINDLPVSERTSQALQQVPKVRSIAEAFDVAMEIPGSRIDAYVRKLIDKYPHASISELQEHASRAYLSRAGILSGTVGAGAAAPGAGTMVATGLTIAELASFYANTTLYVLGMARLQGLTPDNQAQRRALVASALLGDEGAKLVSDQLGLSTLTWARSQLKSMSTPTLSAVNKRLAKYAAKRSAAKTTSRLLGRLLPFGIGAVVGYVSGRKTAKRVVKGIRTSLGQPRNGNADLVRQELQQ